MIPRTFTPDVETVNAEGRTVTTMHLKRVCNGCGEYVGDVCDRDVDARGNLTDVRGECTHCAPVVEFERLGAKTWQVTPRNIAETANAIDRYRMYTKGFWKTVDGELQVVGLRVGHDENRVVAFWGDWIIRHPDGRFTVHAAPTGGGR